jgi:hypothetical protein
MYILCAHYVHALYSLYIHALQIHKCKELWEGWYDHAPTDFDVFKNAVEVGGYGKGRGALRYSYKQ